MFPDATCVENICRFIHDLHALIQPLYTPLWYDAMSRALAAQTSQWGWTLDLDDQQAVKPPNHHPPTCCHIWDALYTNTPWLIPVQEGIHPCRTASSHTLCTAPDPALGSAHRCSPRPHILMLFGMRCRATVSVNTAPGNSDRKPPQLCGKLDAITECTPICTDNSISVSELLLCHSPLFCFYCKTTPALELCIFSPSAVIFQTINDLISMCWFMNS